MEFIAITQQTCSWLLAHPDIVAALHGVIVTEHVDSLRKSDICTGLKDGWIGRWQLSRHLELRVSVWHRK